MAEASNVLAYPQRASNTPPRESSFGSGDPPGPPSAHDALRRTIHNEKVKLRATGLNTIGVGFVVAGMIAPATALIAGTGSTDVPDQALVLMPIWLVGAFILHYAATLTLESTL